MTKKASGPAYETLPHGSYCTRIKNKNSPLETVGPDYEEARRIRDALQDWRIAQKFPWRSDTQPPILRNAFLIEI